MKSKTQFTRGDGIVVFVSVALVLNLSFVGESGRQRAKREVCLANLRLLTLAWNLYADDNEGKVVNGDTQEFGSMYRPGRPPALSHYEEPPWVLKDWSASQTALEKKQAIRDGALFSYTGDIRLYRCPAWARTATRSYSVVDSMNCKGWPGGKPMVKNRSEIERPTERFVFIDHGSELNKMLIMGGWTCYSDEDRWWDPVPVHHNDGANFSFVDGHVEYWKWKDPRTLEFGKQGTAPSGPQNGNEDIRRTQNATWGKPQADDADNNEDQVPGGGASR